jgi:crotonobetainyl-CoA hydratase
MGHADNQQVSTVMRLEFITRSVDRSVVTLTIDRPDVLNAFHPDACRELGTALDQFEADDALRVAIITGCGDRAFSAGFDLQYAEQHPECYSDMDFGSELVRRSDRRKPLIAAVNGVAFGFGFELALACDLIIATGRARFALPEVKVGLAAMAGGVVRLSREIGLRPALALALSGEAVSAAEALRLGIVTEVAEGSALDRAMEWANRLSKLAPMSLVATRQLAYRGRDLPDLMTALDPRQYPAVLDMAASEDAQEGRRAFLARREPQWKNH